MRLEKNVCLASISVYRHCCVFSAHNGGIYRRFRFLRVSYWPAPPQVRVVLDAGYHMYYACLDMESVCVCVSIITVSPAKRLSRSRCRFWGQTRVGQGAKYYIGVHVGVTSRIRRLD